MFRAPAYKHKYNFKTLPRLASSQNNSLEPDIGAGGDVLRTSKLSADALEFYPKSFFEKAQPTPSLHPTSSTPDYVGRHSQQGRLQKRYTSPSYTVYYQVCVVPCFYATPDEDCPPTYYNLSPAQQAAGDLIEVMHRVTISPGCFDDLVKPLIESLSSLLTDRETVETLADIIVEQSITEPNFRYNGARLCSFLNSKFHAGDEPSFRAILLNRCASEHNQMINYLHNDPARLQGLGLFLSELYIQLGVSQSIEERIAILGTAVYDILKELITMPTSDNINKILSMMGYNNFKVTVSSRSSREHVSKTTWEQSG
uniref:MIF4G domain-containing protein n=1 Tax=Timema tahoe TaxID=61484 RepID=A0A7R9NXD0_9NEOP|nr:unnamed protein product [Timema tahoe]